MGYTDKYFGAPVYEETPEDRKCRARLKRRWWWRSLWWKVCDTFWAGVAGLARLIEIAFPIAALIMLHHGAAPPWAFLLFAMAVMAWLKKG
jgi:hypothetical protein